MVDRGKTSSFKIKSWCTDIWKVPNEFMVQVLSEMLMFIL